MARHRAQTTRNARAISQNCVRKGLLEHGLAVAVLNGLGWPKKKVAKQQRYMRALGEPGVRRR